MLAFNLAGIVRGELEAAGGNGWDLRRVQQTVLEAGARIIEQGRRIVVDVARAAGALWGRLLERLGRWRRDATWGSDACGRALSGRPRLWPGRSTRNQCKTDAAGTVRYVRAEL